MGVAVSAVSVSYSPSQAISVSAQNLADNYAAALKAAASPAAQAVAAGGAP